MRRLGVLAVLAALGLSAAGCGGGGGGDNGSSKSESSGATAISQAAVKTSQAAGIKTDFEITGKGIEGGGSGAFDTSKSSSGRIVMTVRGQGQTTNVDTILAGNVLFLRSPVFAQILPPGKRWVRVDLAQLAKQSNLNLGSLVDSNPTPTGALAYLKGSARNVQKVGTETVGGVPTTHYKATIDLEAAAREAKGAERRSIRRVIDVAGVKQLPVQVWIDKQGYVRKVVYTQHTGQQQSARIAMQLHDFGTAVSIASPPASTVLDFQQLLTPQGR